MDYIAVLDYEHLDNGVFLTSFARAIAQQKNLRGLIIHGDSSYTERVIQTGVIREEATIRSTKDLNHRLIALFADHGISTIGLNAYQRSLVKRSDKQLFLDKQQIQQLPNEPNLLLSNLIAVEKQKEPVPIPVGHFTKFLKDQLDIEEVLVFSMDDSEEIIKKERPDQLKSHEIEQSFIDTYIPAEFRTIPFSFRLTTTEQFSNFPETKGTTFIEKSSKNSKQKV